VENVDITPLEAGLLKFTFAVEEDKNRAMDSGPWSSSNNMLLLKN